MTETPRYIKIREAGRLLSVSERTILRFLAGDVLDGFKVGAVVRVNRESIDKLIRTHPYPAATRKGRLSPLERWSRSLRRQAI